MCFSCLSYKSVEEFKIALSERKSSSISHAGNSKWLLGFMLFKKWPLLISKSYFGMKLLHTTSLGSIACGVKGLVIYCRVTCKKVTGLTNGHKLCNMVNCFYKYCLHKELHITSTFSCISPSERMQSNCLCRGCFVYCTCI